MAQIKTDNGFINYSIEEDELIIDLIVVEEKRKGTGKKLINECKIIARELNIPITLFAYPQDDSINQEDLNNFYNSCGFSETESGSEGTFFIY